MTLLKLEYQLSAGQIPILAMSSSLTSNRSCIHSLPLFPEVEVEVCNQIKDAQASEITICIDASQMQYHNSQAKHTFDWPLMVPHAAAAAAVAAVVAAAAVEPSAVPPAAALPVLAVSSPAPPV